MFVMEVHIYIFPNTHKLLRLIHRTFISCHPIQPIIGWSSMQTSGAEVCAATFIGGVTDTSALFERIIQSTITTRHIIIHEDSNASPQPSIPSSNPIQSLTIPPTLAHFQLLQPLRSYHNLEAHHDHQASSFHNQAYIIIISHDHSPFRSSQKNVFH